MKESNSNIKYLSEEPIKKSIIKLSIPMMIGMSVGSIYNIINAYFIGLINDTAMISAITLGLPIFTILMAFGNMFGVGGGTFITRLIAKDELIKAKKVAGYVFYGSIIFGGIMGLVCIIGIDPIINLLGADSLAETYTKEYAITLLAGGFTMVLNFCLEQIVRSEGASKESMYGMFISVLVSIVLDILFILILDMHIYGVALSMIIANLVSSIYYGWWLNNKSENLQGFLYNFKISIKDQFEIYKIGSSELIQCGFLIVTTLLLNNYAIQYGDNVVASFGIALRIVQLPEFFTMGIVLGVMPIIAYNFSNKNINRLKETIKYSISFIVLIIVIFVGVSFLFRNQIIQLFSSDPLVIKVGAYILVAMLISALFNGITSLFMTVYQSSGEGFATGVMAISQGCLFIPMVIILHHIYGFNGLVWAMTITEIITFLIGVILYIPYRKRLSREN